MAQEIAVVGHRTGGTTPSGGKYVYTTIFMRFLAADLHADPLAVAFTPYDGIPDAAKTITEVQSLQAAMDNGSQVWATEEFRNDAMTEEPWISDTDANRRAEMRRRADEIYQAYKAEMTARYAVFYQENAALALAPIGAIFDAT